MFNGNLSKSILRICDVRNLSYESISALCDISVRYLGSIARGRANPTLLVLEKLCTGLQVAPDELLGVSRNKQAWLYRQPMRLLTVRQYPACTGGMSLYPVCPRCHYTMEREYQAFCDHCGQRIYWSFLRYAALITL